MATPTLGFSATHVVLLREPVTNMAKLFMFGESGSSQTMKFWRFEPGDTNLVTPLTNSAISRLDTLSHPNTKRVDLFCTGHATLADGRMVLIGGSWLPTGTCEDSYTLDPSWNPGSTSPATPWTRNAEMSVQRWYATATTLPDGRVLASAGTSASTMFGFGGTSAGVTIADTTSRKLRPLELSSRFSWGDTILAPACNACSPPPQLVPLTPNDDFTQGQFAPGREYHMFAGAPYGHGVIYGGRRKLANGNPELLDDAWLVTDSNRKDDSTHACYLMEQVGDPNVSENGGRPSKRWGFAATWAGVENNPGGKFYEGTGGDVICFLHGGKDASGHVLGDLWRGQAAIVGSRYKWTWTRILADDTTSARFGHSLCFDPGVPDLPNAPRAKLLVYGGSNSTGALAPGDRVFAIGVGGSSAQPGAWRSILIGGSTPAPSARMWHSMIPRYKGPDEYEREYFLFGGEDASGALSSTQLYVLSRNDLRPPNATGPRDEEAYIWETKTISGVGPTHRSRASLGYAVDGGILVVFGGDTTGTQTAGGLSNELFRLQAGYTSGSWEWSSPPGRNFHGTPPPTAGMPLIAAGEGVARITRNMEAFTPNGTSSLPQCNTTGFGSWQSATLPTTASERPMADYPNLHVLPDGRVFHAGPAPGFDLPKNRYKRFFDLGTKQWSDAGGGEVQDSALFGSSVMYRPGKLLRAGSETATGHTLTETIDLTASGSQALWVPYVDSAGGNASHPAFLRRTHGNLTVLPTGDVLATGGVPRDVDIASSSTRIPQLWRARDARWTTGVDGSLDALSLNPHIRNYHSVALLLPDARVLTAGGEKDNPDETTSSVFEPPYLFDATGGYASRPRIQNGPDLLSYGRELTIKLTNPARASSVKSVAVIRSGAVTHGFDQGQRYVPLEFVAKTGPDRLLVHGPANANVAPPGDYMLFVVDSVSAGAPAVPSIARWVRILPGTPTIVDTADVTPPAGGTFLDLRDTGCENEFTLKLSWKAPADDDTVAFSGPARAYSLRYAPNATAPTDFNLWTLTSTATPGPLNSVESAYISNITSNLWYKVGLKAAGDNNDVSTLSNTVITRGRNCSEGGGGGYLEGDGGGGGYSSTRASSFKATSATSATSTPRENTLFPGATIGTIAVDHLRLAGAPRLIDGVRSVYIREGAARGLDVDRVRLLAADRPLGTETVVDAHGTFFTGIRQAASAVHDRFDHDMTLNAVGAAPEPVYADSGEVLNVELFALGQAAGPLLLDLSDGGSAGGVEVETLEPGEQWLPRGVAHPRQNQSLHAFDLQARTQVRLRFKEACAVHFVGQLGSTGAPVIRSAPLVSAASQTQSWIEAVSARDSLHATIPSGDTLRLAFEDIVLAGGSERDWYLVIEGTPLSPEVATFKARPAGGPMPTPTAFALHQNAPNPFARATRISYDLPVGATVRLEIFDTQGRLVRRFVALESAGRHSIDWDLRDAHGSLAAPGIYSYRMSARGFEAKRKMVVIP